MSSTAQTPQQILAAIYDAGAQAYERYWAPALHLHARALLHEVPPPDGRSRVAVDVAAGAGTLTSALRELVGPSGLVIAADRSHGMLSLAGPDVPRLQSDAAHLPLADSCADIVVLAFVLFLLPDARAAVTEAARILKPGGWLLAATWGGQDGTAADVVVREELDGAGAPPAPQLPRSDELTDTADRMAALLTSAGLTDVRTSSRPLDAAFDAEAARVLRLGAGVLGWRCARLDAQARQQVHRRVAERLAELPPDALVDRSEVLLTTARRRAR